MIIDRLQLKRKTLRRAMLLFVLAIAAIAPFPYRTLAQSAQLSVSPAVVDEKAEARDIINKSITIVNTSERKLSLYPSVNDIRPEDGAQNFSRAGNSEERSDSLANWIELSRGVIEINPGEERVVPFVMRVNLNAVPGSYHAQISFLEGSTRIEAEARPPLAVVTVNLEIKADIREVLQLAKFSTDNVVFTGDDVIFKYQLQNIGNRELQPTGEISIYDRRGQEIASIDLNKEGKSIAPEQVSQLASVWSAGSGFGRYKAHLTVNYGSQTAAVQDTVFFWVVPWKQLLGLFTVSIIATIIFALYFQRWFEERHLLKLAHSGLLKVEAMAHIPHLWHTSGESVPLSPVQEKPPEKPLAGRFAFFNKHTRPTPSPVPLMRPFLPNDQHDAPPRRSLREALAHHEKNPVHGSTIDLKKIKEREERTLAAHMHAHGHVINLKKLQ